ncbi:EAL domain-containing protein [Sphingomonas sp.]|uniref:putative bifunctional diguanylate cyclase/phosphodiesterase n=1 Tax=Sphingomonas sp. TaxID=28214 RepID=UPI00286BE6DA|nr:EAL domain-containing protein [Sphingomonas sp.]
MSSKRNSGSRGTSPSVANARRDALVLAILIGAVMLLIWNGSMFFRELQFADARLGSTARIASTALMLNVALILFGWRRYVDLHHESERRQDSEARAGLIATTDALTGLLNRRGFADRAARLTGPACESVQQVVLFSIQLNRFKGINDRFGFDVGDETLRRIAAGVIGVADDYALVARTSGDEFAVALAWPGHNIKAIEISGEALLRTVTASHEIDGKLIQVGAFIGMAMSDAADVTIADLLRRADIALEHAKTGRSTKAVWFDAGMERALLANSELEQGVLMGIEHDQFEPYFEPQVDLETGTIVGFEVLARWNHPMSGIIMPDTFIPVAEDLGVIGRLSEQLMRLAFTAAAKWDPAIKLSVNISPLQLGDPWLAQKIVRILTETGFPADRLVLEITESSLFGDMDQAHIIVTSLKNQGIRLALDDFGSGFSSLSHLRALPFDVIKIDRSFVTTIHRDRESSAIVRAVTTLATAIGVPVTVEGIEDAATCAAVIEMGCAVGQGWYFGKPTSAHQAEQLLRDRPETGISDLSPCLRRAVA